MISIAKLRWYKKGGHFFQLVTSFAALPNRKTTLKMFKVAIAACAFLLVAVSATPFRDCGNEFLLLQFFNFCYFFFQRSNHVSKSSLLVTDYRFCFLLYLCYLFRINCRSDRCARTRLQCPSLPRLPWNKRLCRIRFHCKYERKQVFFFNLFISDCDILNFE